MIDKPNDITWQAKWGKMALSKGVTVIPTAFLLHASRAGLNPAQQILIIHLVSYWWKAGRDPYPSLKELRRRTGMTEKTISKHLKGLEDKMWLTRKRRYNNSYRYDLDRLARRVAWLSGDQTAMARDKFHPTGQQAPSPSPHASTEEQPAVEDERPQLAPSLEDIKKFMEDGE
jgi:hypothetical protein